MNSPEELWLAIAACSVVTYIPRCLPMAALKAESLSKTARLWLSFIPISVLAALLGPDIFMQGETLNLTPKNIFLIATIPTLLVAAKTKNFFGTIATGMASVALLRYFFS